MESNEIKRGGARLGAGRKARDMQRWMEMRGIHPASAAEILANSDERKKWHRVLNSDDDRVVLSALTFLVQMRDGKPSQSVNITSTNFNLNARDLESARAIIREIRGDAAIAMSNPSLGAAIVEGEAIALSNDNAGVSSPLQVDVASGEGIAGSNDSEELCEGEEDIAQSKPMLLGDEGGNSVG